MTTIAWLLLAACCMWQGWRWGYREGADTARELAALALERERARCRELRMTQVFGPRAERVTRPHHAECN